MSIGYLLIPTLFVHVQVLFALLVYITGLQRITRSKVEF